MGIFRRRSAGHTRAPQELPPDSPFTTAGHAARGQVSGSGEVAPWNQLQPYGGTPAGYTAPHVLPVGDPSWVQPVPDSLYVTRELRGGVASFPTTQFVGMPALGGGHVVMAHRPDLARADAPEQQPQAFETSASWREAPSAVQLCRTVREV